MNTYLMQNIPRSLSQLAGMSLLSLSGSPGSAQQTPVPMPPTTISATSAAAPDWLSKSVTLSVHEQSFVAVLETLSKQIGCGIVADGEPLLPSASFDLSGTAKEILDKVCDRFDCAWSIGRRGQALLHKRFRIPQDTPQMYLPEMRKMAHDILQIWPPAPNKAHISRYPFTALDIYPANALYRTFSDAQRQTLQSGRDLTYAELTSQQQSLVRLGILNGVLGTSRDIWEKLDSRLTGLSDAYLQWRPWDKAVINPGRASLDLIWRNRGGNEEWVRLLSPTVIEQIEERKNHAQP